MISEYYAKAFCRDDISLIENYDKAIADDTQTWHCHHRRETIFSKPDLIEIGEYYNRPACELIFLTKSEHIRLHKIGENNPNFGKPAWNNGKHLSAETRKKISEARKGKQTCIKGTNWYNNGVKSIRAKTCPDGFVPGRIVCNKRS